MLYGKLALVAASLFTGAAFYIGFSEQPARLQLRPEELLKQWKTSFNKAKVMQASLIVIGSSSAFWQFYLDPSDQRWLVGGVLILANIPYTQVMLMPINNKLLRTLTGDAGLATTDLITRWGRLHSVRTLFGAAAVGIFFSAI